MRDTVVVAVRSSSSDYVVSDQATTNEKNMMARCQHSKYGWCDECTELDNLRAENARLREHVKELETCDCGAAKNKGVEHINACTYTEPAK